MHDMCIRIEVCVDFVLCAYVSARCVVSVPRDVVLVGWICGGFLSRMNRGMRAGFTRVHEVRCSGVKDFYRRSIAHRDATLQIEGERVSDFNNVGWVYWARF